MNLFVYVNIAGMRRDVNVLIFLNVRKALEGKITADITSFICFP